ncbi:YqaJ viral recombinase family nuclease [Amycolatopsis sp. H20-H5]|uniref:YqaJ viral recombinase family nuclease n=1 Tax=Amycolatopsis sp. H20-H5 TaxID=3046309 RepID=UPI002DBC8F6B|nr:YqaJ viral recombinase family protein [Amycolatopsis sp. H20-H5]MEC3977874.1 YqaJ viral recombinase family protein [Amycolatopsis sp. H20-H5]
MTSTLIGTSWAVPAARLVLPADADRETWLVERRLGLGGSDAPALLCESPHQSRYGLWLDKTGQVEDSEATDAMRRGNWLEPLLARWFTERTDIAGRRCGLLASRELDFMRTTPDRLTADGGVLEIKTMGAFAKVAAEWKGGGIARHAYIQAQQQLAVTGRTHAWFVVWQDPTPQLRGPVPRDEALIEEITAATVEFWTEHVLTGVPPEVDLANLTDDEIALRWPLAIGDKAVETPYPAHTEAMLAERAEVKKRIADDEQRAKEIDRALRVLTGDAEALTLDGRSVVTFKNQANSPQLDKALRADHPEIYDRYVTRGTSRRIHVVKTKKKDS